MPDTPSIVITKSMLYRGVAEQWSNKYHFSGPTPANDAAWKALGQAIWAQEAGFLNATVSIVGITGYEAGVAAAKSTVLHADSNFFPTTGQAAVGTQAPGDAAMWVRWATPARNSKGKPIYLRKYFHGFNVTPPDTIQATTKANAVTYAGKMTDGTLPNGVKLCGPQGAVAGTAKVPSFTTTRTLKRRGKDPS